MRKRIPQGITEQELKKMTEGINKDVCMDESAWEGFD